MGWFDGWFDSGTTVSDSSFGEDLGAAITTEDIYNPTYGVGNDTSIFETPSADMTSYPSTESLYGDDFYLNDTTPDYGGDYSSLFDGVTYEGDGLGGGGGSGGGSPKDEEESWISGALKSPDTWKGILSGGTALYGMYNQKKTSEDAMKRSEEADKMKFLVELAKLKYGQKSGGGGGGGGAGRPRYLDIINALEASKRSQGDAYQALMAGYSSAYS